MNLPAISKRIGIGRSVDTLDEEAIVGAGDEKHLTRCLRNRVQAKDQNAGRRAAPEECSMRNT
jgi:hypothetical protein